MDPFGHGRNQMRLAASDTELAGFFSSAIGIRAQSYESGGGAFRASEAHDHLVREIERGSMARFDAVARTVAELPFDERCVVAAVYTPHGEPTWLADALSVPWGNGGFVELAASLPRALRAAAKRPAGASVRDWLHQRGRKTPDPLLISLREECEERRVRALVTYDELRVARLRISRRAREAARDAAVLARAERYAAWVRGAS